MAESTIFPMGGGGGGGAASSVPFSGVTTGTNTVLLEMTGQVNISGPDATTNVEIGSVANDANAGTGGTSVVIGNSAANGGNATGAVVIGSGASNPGAATSAVVIGVGATNSGAGSNNILIGNGATNNGSNSTISIGAAANGKGGIAIGSSADGGNAGSIAIGLGAISTTAVFVAGADSSRMNNVFFGAGMTSTTASTAAYTINGTGGSGADNAGGALNLAGGKSTGNAVPGVVNLQGTASARGASSSTAGTLVNRVTTGVVKSLANNTVTTIVSATNVNNSVLNFIIQYGVEVFNGTDLQYEVGEVAVSLINKAGVWSANTALKYGNQQGLGSGTLTVTWTITGANPALIQVNANSSLTPSTGYPTITCNVINLTQQAFTLP
jgi:hypothetical protein